MILITAFLNTDHELDQRIKLSLHEPWYFLIKDGGQYILYNYLKIIKSKILYVLETFVSVSVSAM
jgi:hypothetical protein